MPSESVLDVLIIGAGVIGSSVAMHLARAGVSGIRVVDLDLEGTLSSSELNAGGVRATFNQRINIEMSKLSIEYFARHAEDMGYRDVGYLWLHKPETFEKARAAAKLQHQSGWPVEQWDVSMLRQKIPFIDKTSDLAGALFAARDGLVNPNLVKNHYRAEARKLGVVFEDRVFIQDSREVSSHKLKVMGLKLPAQLSHEDKIALYSGAMIADHPKVPKVENKFEFTAGIVINCSGAWASGIAKKLGYESPSYPLRRQISIFDCREVDLSRYGMIVDTSGVYFHPEATNGLAGFATHLAEDRGFNYEYGGEEFFMEHIWSPLYERSTSFEKLKHVTGWAGIYEVSPDESAILGRASRGSRTQFNQVYEAHSFSGHGLMHCHAAGIALAELITRERFETIDVSVLSADRFAAGKLIHESAVI
jgi:FAD-dependent oxidoreductase domain-containing protein 1